MFPGQPCRHAQEGYPHSLPGKDERGHLPNLGNPSLRQLQQYLHGVNFPAQRDGVAFSAESNGAPQSVVDGIRNAAQNRFHSQDEVLQAVKGQ